MPIVLDGDEYLFTDEAATLAGRTVDTIGNWCRKGKVEGRQDGNGRWLIKKISLEAFIRGNGNHGNTDMKSPLNGQ